MHHLNASEEDDDHPFHCTNTIIKEAQYEALSTLHKDLNSIRTYPVLTEAIIHYTKSWMRQENPTFINKLLPNVLICTLFITTIHQQNKIVWDHLVRGRITKTWTKTQHKYSPNRGYDIWTLKFIHLLQKVNQKIWEVRNNLIYGDGKRKSI